jgi:hypothetical protein
VTQVIFKEEIEFIKKRKIQRFNEFIRDFHANRVKRLQEEMEIWKKVKDHSFTISALELLDERLVQGNMKIEALNDANKDHK